MKQVKIFFTIVFIINTYYTFSQNGYSLSFGASIPDNISNKFFNPGPYFSYGLCFKISEHLSVKPNISILFNSKNPKYTFGFDDEPNFELYPDTKEWEKFIRSKDPDYYKNKVLYLFNPYVSINMDYLILPKHSFCPYIFIGLSTDYSVYENPVEIYEFNTDGTVRSISERGGVLHQKLNVGFETGLGINKSFKNYKTVFLQVNYKLQPFVHYGRNRERVGLFLVNFGFSSPFSKRERYEETEEDPE